MYTPMTLHRISTPKHRFQTGYRLLSPYKAVNLHQENKKGKRIEAQMDRGMTGQSLENDNTKDKTQPNCTPKDDFELESYNQICVSRVTRTRVKTD
jgi:hypothetical protein